jgi:thymidine phosphorylase
VPSIPLIVSSILSKKLAENLDALVLDVKFGVAAFMQTKAEARKLARAMVALGNECGVNTRAILSDVNAPVGRTAGNWIEVKGAVTCLGRSTSGELSELVIACAAQLLVQTRKAKTLEAAKRMAMECWDSGAPRAKWDEMIVAQGADLEAFKQKIALDHTAAVVVEMKSRKAGFVSRCDARVIGEVVRDLGGGRLTKESKINYDVGIDGLMKPGHAVERGSTLARVHAASQQEAAMACDKLKAAFEISARKPKRTPLIAEIISKV